VIKGDAWVHELRGEAFQMEPTVISSHKVVKSSDPQFAHLSANVVDESSSEWWTEQASAWLEIDLGEVCSVTTLRIQWWGISVAGTYQVFSCGSKHDEWVPRRSQAHATAHPKGYNSWTELPGWQGQTRKVRIELADGSKDPWGMNKWFGIRQLNVHGNQLELPSSAAGLMKMSAKIRLDEEVVTTVKGGRAADAGAQVASNTLVLACARAYIHEKIDEVVAKMEGRCRIPVEDLSLGRSARVSDCEERAANLVDGTDSEWWTDNDTAWFEIDLQQMCTVNGIRFHWWGTSVASVYRIYSSSDGATWKEQRTHEHATSHPEGYNSWSEIPGWYDATTYVRVELAEGSLDPWWGKMQFGLRNCCVIGRKGHQSFGVEA
jgi:hypothetical protein